MCYGICLLTGSSWHTGGERPGEAEGDAGEHHEGLRRPGAREQHDPGVQVRSMAQARGAESERTYVASGEGRREGRRKKKARSAVELFGGLSLVSFAILSLFSLPLCVCVCVLARLFRLPVRALRLGSFSWTSWCWMVWREEGAC